MKSITWKNFIDQLNKVKFGKFDLIIAIGSGGIIPGAFIQKKLKIPLDIIWINYRDERNNPKYGDALLLEQNKFSFKGKKILLVDDVCRSGKTIARAKEYLKRNKITTFVINGRADYSLFNEKECIIMPWIKYGELLKHTE